VAPPPCGENKFTRNLIIGLSVRASESVAVHMSVLALQLITIMSVNSSLAPWRNACESLGRIGQKWWKNRIQPSCTNKHTVLRSGQSGWARCEWC